MTGALNDHSDANHPQWIVVARILRPRGNKGEVAAELLTDFPERLTKINQVFLGRVNGDNISGPPGHTEPNPIGVKSCWLSQNHCGQGVFHFEGVTSINDAERFRGLHVLLPFAQRVTLEAGQYFVSDLVGCAVFSVAQSGAVVSSSPCSMAIAPEFLGTVRNVQFPGEGEKLRGTPLLEVDTGQGELLVPLAHDICTDIDISARRIEVVLPEGLRDLNFT